MRLCYTKQMKLNVDKTFYILSLEDQRKAVKTCSQEKRNRSLTFNHV